MDHSLCGELPAKLKDEADSMQESIRECEKLRVENDTLRQNYLNTQATLTNLQKRYGETKKALLRQLDINRKRDDEFQEIEKRLSQSPTTRQQVVDESSALKALVAEISFEKKNDLDALKKHSLQKDLELWQNKYYEEKQDHEIVKSKFDLLSKNTIRNLESIEEANKADTLSFREKVLNLIKGHLCERSPKSHHDKYWLELQEANFAIQKFKVVEAELRADLINAVDKRKLEEKHVIDLNHMHHVELAEARKKIILQEKDISSLQMQVKSQSDKVMLLEAVIEEKSERISSLEVDSRTITKDLEKCKKNLLDNQIKNVVDLKQMSRLSDAQIAELQTHINELEQFNSDLTHQTNDLQCLLKKQKQENIIKLEETVRENLTSLVKYRNDNTKLVVNVSTSEDLIKSQDKFFRCEILRLENEYDKCHQELSTWKNECTLVTSLLSYARATEESLKNSLHDAEGKALIHEGIHRDMENKIHENQQELTIMKDEKRILEERLCNLTHQCSSLQEQLKSLQEVYEEERSQVKTSLGNDRARLHEDFQNKVETLNIKLSKERRKSAVYKEKLLDAHRKNVEAKVALTSLTENRWNN